MHWADFVLSGYLIICAKWWQGTYFFSATLCGVVLGCASQAFYVSDEHGRTLHQQPRLPLPHWLLYFFRVFHDMSVTFPWRFPLHIRLQVAKKAEELPKGRRRVRSKRPSRRKRRFFSSDDTLVDVWMYAVIIILRIFEVYTYIHTCMHACMHACIQTDRQTDRHTHTHIHTYTQTHRHTDTQTHRHTDTQTHRHTDTQTHIHTYTHTHIHTYTHTHIHTLHYITLHYTTLHYITLHTL